MKTFFILIIALAAFAKAVPEANAAPEPEASAAPKPEASAAPEPEASAAPEPEPEASAAPEPEASAAPEPEASAAPEPEAEPETPATCVLKPESASKCKRLAAADHMCTKCVTSACGLCRTIFVKHCVKPTPVASVAACVKARGGACWKKFKSNKWKLARCLKGIKKQCETHVCAHPEPEPETEAPATCVLVPDTRSNCKRLAAADDMCTKCVTSACGLCRTIFVEHCVKPTPVASVAACVEARGRACVKKFKKNQRKLAKCLKGVEKQCATHVCTPATDAPTEAPKETEAPATEAPKEPTAAPEPEATTAPKGTPAPEPEATPAPEPEATPAPEPVPEPKVCNHDIVEEDLPNVIYIAAEEEDCTTDLKKEVNDLELLVDKLTLLLTVKGVEVGKGEKCALPPKKGKSKKDGKTTAPGNPTTVGGATTPPKKGGSKKDGKTTAPGNPTTVGGATTPPKKGGSKKDGKTTGPGESKTTAPGTPPKKGGSKKSETTAPGSPPNSPPERVSSTSGSSAAVNTMLVVGLVVGSAVAAGVAAVAIGFIASGAGASAAAPASAAAMGAAATNPLYTPLTSGGSNAMFG